MQISHTRGFSYMVISPIMQLKYNYTPIKKALSPFSFCFSLQYCCLLCLWGLAVKHYLISSSLHYSNIILIFFPIYRFIKRQLSIIFRPHHSICFIFLPTFSNSWMYGGSSMFLPLWIPIVELCSTPAPPPALVLP